jgi:pyruvate/2-oxoglutarate dehydrogenase complex dihydrolipoamide acyltransferase (E2) component
VKRNRAAWIFVTVVVVLVGCIGGEPEPLPPGQPAAPVSAPAQAAPVSPPAVPGPAAGQAVQAAPPAPAAVPQAAANPAVSEANRQQATVGVGKKGRGYGGGLITTPIAAYFSVQERLKFLQVTHDMQIYVAEHGRPPKTQEEFMEKIIKAGSIELPQLRGNDRYVYLSEKVNLPEDSGLWIERPAE